MPYQDLSRTIHSDMPVFPGDPSVRVEPHASMADDGYRVSAIDCGSHTGTHVDAPSHTEPDGRTIDSYPPERFVLDAVRVDLRGRDPRSRIGPDDVPSADAEVAVFQTGWDEHWGTPTALDHPFLTPDAAERCVEQGYDVATDALNVDPTPSERASTAEHDGVPAHHALLGAGQLIVENLTALAGLPERFELRALPLKIDDGDGAPVRAVARYE
jgi:kynurenine formamidase